MIGFCHYDGSVIMTGFTYVISMNVVYGVERFPQSD